MSHAHLEPSPLAHQGTCEECRQETLVEKFGRYRSAPAYGFQSSEPAVVRTLCLPCAEKWHQEPLPGDLT